MAPILVSHLKFPLGCRLDCYWFAGHCRTDIVKRYLRRSEDILSSMGTKLGSLECQQCCVSAKVGVESG